MQWGNSQWLNAAGKNHFHELELKLGFESCLMPYILPDTWPSFSFAKSGFGHCTNIFHITAVYVCSKFSSWRKCERASLVSCWSTESAWSLFIDIIKPQTRNGILPISSLQESFQYPMYFISSKMNPHELLFHYFFEFISRKIHFMYVFKYLSIYILNIYLICGLHAFWSCLPSDILALIMCVTLDASR